MRNISVFFFGFSWLRAFRGYSMSMSMSVEDIEEEEEEVLAILYKSLQAQSLRH